MTAGSLLGNDFYRSSFEAQLRMRLLPEESNATPIQWERMTTAADATISLADDVATDPSTYLSLDPAYRPAIAQRTNIGG